uniref:Complex 1 LYR protein domain-containing protein n=1 Tax=Cyprinus carpio TaxID=7962 RepID=A0A8C2J2E5_CYPCA
MAASSREHVLSLYRLLLKESEKFPSYNYSSTYTLRAHIGVRDAFKENRTVEDPKVVKELLNRAQDSLALIQRQVLVQKIDVSSVSHDLQKSF